MPPLCHALGCLVPSSFDPDNPFIGEETMVQNLHQAAQPEMVPGLIDLDLKWMFSGTAPGNPAREVG